MTYCVRTVRTYLVQTLHYPSRAIQDQRHAISSSHPFVPITGEA